MRCCLEDPALSHSKAEGRSHQSTTHRTSVCVYLCVYICVYIRVCVCTYIVCVSVCVTNVPY